jgi:nitrite reductase/ring-hydroxylating ferredoxin subunit
MLRVLLASCLAVAGAFHVPAGLTKTQPRAAVSMVDKSKKIPDKNVWVPMVNAAEVKPGTITSGFQYGIEVAVVCTEGGKLYGFFNKMPPTGQPTTAAKVEGNVIIEPITLTAFDLSTGKQTGPWCPSNIGRLLIGRLTTPQNLETVKVKKAGNAVQALINVNAKAQFEQNYWRGVLDAAGKVDGGYY